MWVLCDNLPVLVARDRLRPCNSAELLAFQYMQQQKTEERPDRSTRYRDKCVDESDRQQKRTKTDQDQQLSRATTFTGGGSSSSAAPAVQEPTKRKDVVAEEADPEEDPRSDGTSLAQIWKKAKITGKGVQLLDKVAYYFEDDPTKDSDRVGFLQVRLVQGKEKARTKKQVKKDGDKNLRFKDCTPDIQEGLRKSRCVEWDKWTQFNAAVVMSKAEVDQLVKEGVTIQPMQWVETDKNAHKRRPNGPYVEPLLKSRLVGCGNYEETDGLRTDSPAGDVDAHNVIFSWCAAHHVRIKSADISNAYLQGCLARKWTGSSCTRSLKEEYQRETYLKGRYWRHVYPYTGHEMQEEDSGSSSGMRC